MENPATWGPAEKIIERVLHDHEKLPRGTCGLSVNRKIADALRDAGLLYEDDGGTPEIFIGAGQA